MDIITPFLLFVFFALGMCFGSFANVCIYRLPLNLSIVRPRSACPKCKKQIEWYDNVPVFSFLYLGGKCRGCKTPISMIYPLVEMITGLSFALIFYYYGLSPATFLFCFMAFCLVVISGIDYYYQIIPDIFPLMLLIAGIALSFLNTTLGASYGHRIINAALGVLAGGGVLLIIGLGGQFLFKKEAMGGGDVKLMAGVGAIIGWEKVLLAIFIASFLGSIVGVFLMLTKKIEKKGYMAFGPFLAVSAYATLLLPAPATLVNMFFLWETKILQKIAGL